jgi:prevent-host-death family protein
MFMNTTRSVADAKSHFADCIASAEAGEPVVITRHGKPVAAIVRAEDLATSTRLGEDSPQAGLAGIMGTWDDDDIAGVYDEIAAHRRAPRLVAPFTGAYIGRTDRIRTCDLYHPKVD